MWKKWGTFKIQCLGNTPLPPFSPVPQLLFFQKNIKNWLNCWVRQCIKLKLLSRFTRYYTICIWASFTIKILNCNACFCWIIILTATDGWICIRYFMIRAYLYNFTVTTQWAKNYENISKLLHKKRCSFKNKKKKMIRTKQTNFLRLKTQIRKKHVTKNQWRHH